MRQWSPTEALRAGRRSTVARQVSSLWLSEGVVLLAGLVQTVVVARILGPREYGRAALVMAFPTLVFSFFDPNSSEAVVRFMTDARFKGRRLSAVARFAYLVDGSLAVAGVAAVAALGPWAEGSVVRVDGSLSLLVLYAAALGFNAPWKTSAAVLATFDRFGTTAAITSIAAGIRIVLVLGLVLADAGTAGVVIGYGVGIVVQSVLGLRAAGRVLHEKLGESWRAGSTRELGGERREIGRFMLYTNLITFVTTFVKQADIVVLGWARGPVQAGYYRLGLALLSPVASIVQPMQQVVYPQIARLVGEGRREEVKATIRRHALVLGIPIAALVAIAAVAARHLVPAVAGASYEQAAAVAQILILGAAATVAFYWVRPAFLAFGLVRPLLGLSSILGGVTVIGFLLVAPQSGALGVATVRAVVAGLAGSAVNAAALLVITRRASGAEGRQ